MKERVGDGKLIILIMTEGKQDVDWRGTERLGSIDRICAVSLSVRPCVCHVCLGVRTANELNQSIFVYYGMTKCRPTPRKQKGNTVSKKKACRDDKPKN